MTCGGLPRRGPDFCPEQGRMPWEHEKAGGFPRSPPARSSRASLHSGAPAAPAYETVRCQILLWFTHCGRSGKRWSLRRYMSRGIGLEDP